MKTKFLILTLFIGTLFVACNNKGGGGNNPYTNGYPNNGYLNTNNGYLNQNGMPGFQLQGCSNSPMFSDLVSFCGWLASSGEQACEPLQVQQTFVQYCSQFRNQLGYCVNGITVPGYQAGFSAGFGIGPSGVYTYRSSGSSRSKGSSGGSSTFSRPTTGAAVPMSKPSSNSTGSTGGAQTKPPVVVTQPTQPTQPVVTDESRPTTPAETFSLREDQAPAKFENLENSESFVKPTQEASVDSLDLSQCFNLQKLHEELLDEKNELSSYSNFRIISPVASDMRVGDANQLYIPLEEQILRKTVYPTRSSAWANGHLSGDGQQSALGVKGYLIQDNNKLIDSTRSGKILKCLNNNYMEVEFTLSTVRDPRNKKQYVKYTWNGLHGAEMIIDEVLAGTFISSLDEKKFVNYEAHRFVRVENGRLNFAGVQKKVLTRLAAEEKVLSNDKRENSFNIFHKIGEYLGYPKMPATK